MRPVGRRKRDRGVRRRVGMKVVGNNKSSRGGFDHENNLLECFSSMIVRLGRHPHKACNHFEKNSGKQDTSLCNIPCDGWSIILYMSILYNTDLQYCDETRKHVSAHIHEKWCEHLLSRRVDPSKINMSQCNYDNETITAKRSGLFSIEYRHSHACR